MAREAPEAPEAPESPEAPLTTLTRHLRGLWSSYRTEREPAASAATRAPSTRIRILGWYMALLAVAMIFGLILQRQILLGQMNDEIDAQLTQEVQELESLTGGRNPLTGEPFGRDVRAIFNTFLSRNIPVEGEAFFTIVDGQPHASTFAPVQLLDDPTVVARWAAIEQPRRAEMDTSAGRVRYLAVPVRDDVDVTGVFVVAMFLQAKRAHVDRVLRTGALVFGSTFVAASAVAWVVAGRALRPVGLLTEAARSVSDSSWGKRIPVHGDDEIAELAHTFNDMIERLEASFETQRRFIDDAGHELRTPITIIRGHLELLQANPTDGGETIALVIDELDRMTRIVEDLLLLAKAEQPDFLDLSAVDLAELTSELLVKAMALGQRDWRLSQSARVVVIADRQRLTQAVMNLARNAVEHTAEGAKISIGSRYADDLVYISVADEGEGIAPGDQTRIFERFSRGRFAKRNADGAGLGLSIVSAIAEAHGGHVALTSEPGSGSTFTIVLPVGGPPDGTA